MSRIQILSPPWRSSKCVLVFAAMLVSSAGLICMMPIQSSGNYNAQASLSSFALQTELARTRLVSQALQLSPDVSTMYKICFLRSHPA